MKKDVTIYHKISRILVGVVFLVLLAAGGCSNVLMKSPGAPEAAGPGGGVKVTLRLFTGSARTVMPEMDLLTWHITAKQGTDNIEATGTYPTYTLELPSVGRWIFTVKGINPTGDEIFTGSITQEIGGGSSVTISIPLSPGSAMTAGTGQINLTLKVPDTVGTVMYKLDSDTEFTDLTPSNGSCSLNKAGVSAGPHTLSLYFLDERGTTLYMCTEAVNVWNGMTSSQWINTGNIGYITGNGEFELTDVIIDAFLNTMGSVVYVNDSVAVNAPATGSIFAPVKTVSTAVDILRKANPDGNYIGTIMVFGATTITNEVQVQSGETLTVKGTGENASITNTTGRVFNITGGSVTLGDGITLTGTVTGENARGGAVYVTGGAFTMESGSTIADSSVQGTSASGGGVYVMNGTFIMEDGSKITGSSATVSGGGVAVSTGGTFTMRGGTIDGTGASSNAESGGGVEIYDAIFTMEGGTITDNNATYGGGVRVDSGEFIMKDGTISDNNATNLGGGVCVINGSFTMSDTATIQGNTATTHGGGVYVNGRNFEMIGGTIGGTDAGSANFAQYGGGVYVNGGAFTMESGSKITGSRATGTTASGGAVYVAGGTFTMNGTAILQGNTATTHGGGVHILSGGTFIMNGGTIDGTIGGTAGNTAENGGGVFVSGGTFNMYDGTISGNTVTESGGGVCISGGTFTMSDSAVISGNTATRSGGGVFVSGSGNFIMEGGTIGGTGGESHNSAENGGGVYIHNGAFTMSDGSISGNTATDNGGGVYVGDGTFTMSGGAVIRGNIASSSSGSGSGSGGGVFVQDGTFTLSGSPNISGNYRLAVDNINNVYLASEKTITIGAEGLTGGTIGVTVGKITAGDVVKITNENVSDADEIFTSDEARYAIVESSGAVYLSDAETKYVVTDGAEAFGAFTSALSAVNASGGTITLLKNIDGSNAVFGVGSVNNQPITFEGSSESISFILDLNGKTIDRKLSAAAIDGSVIKIEGGALTIKDSSAINLDGTGGTGTITGGNSSNTGGGVYVEKDCTFIMNGGIISKNTTGKNGGGVYVNAGTFTMDGGTISGNKAGENGGGVSVVKDGVNRGKFTMNGGAISGNTATQNGGGVNIADIFTMNGGTISGNKAGENGGGVNIGGGNFTMIGGTISGNTATQNGGGVYATLADTVADTGYFWLGEEGKTSSPVISGNKKADGTHNNAYLFLDNRNRYMNINGPLQKTKSLGNVGISMDNPGRFTINWTKNSGLTNPDFFFSDKEGYGITGEGGELKMAPLSEIP